MCPAVATSTRLEPYYVDFVDDSLSSPDSLALARILPTCADVLRTNDLAFRYAYAVELINPGLIALGMALQQLDWLLGDPATFHQRSSIIQH